MQWKRIDHAIERARENSGYTFHVEFAEEGETGSVHDRARSIHGELPQRASAVLVYLDLALREVVIVTGTEAKRTLTDGDCKLASATMVSSFSGGDFVGGLVAGILQMGEAARGLKNLHARTPVLH